MTSQSGDKGRRQELDAAHGKLRGRLSAVKQRARGPDPWLYVPTAILLLIGTLMVLNTTYFIGRAKTGDGFYFFEAQLAHIAAGLIVGAVLSQFSLAGLRRLATPLSLAASAMMIAGWIPGVGLVRGGARRWVRLGPFLAQPSELVKFAMVFFLADLLARRGVRVREVKAGLIPIIAIVVPVIAMLLKEPDFGSAVIIVVLAFAMLLTAGARLKHLAAAAGIALSGLAAQVIVEPYRMRRLAAFVDPWRTARGAGFQLIQSFIALGEGGKWGQGLGLGRQKMFYLPQAHTDFVFAVLIDDIGLVGGLAVLTLFAVVAFRGMRIAHSEPDSFGSLLGAGISSLFALQVLINIAVVVGLVPTKGLPLPLLSYGGSSIVMALAQVGVLLALSSRPSISVAKREYSVSQPPAGLTPAMSQRRTFDAAARGEALGRGRLSHGA
ncbi:MAG: putative lipid II flippase FtsW [Deltaproteobacteria bacterium]|nr:putative lipid II flippase FtsW [Deltaproteobacteria bacterium]